MEYIGRLLLVNLGLLLVSEYVSSNFDGFGNVRLYGDDFFNPGRDMTYQLRRLKKDEADLTEAIARRRSAIERIPFEMQLRNVRASIAQMEARLKVPFKDHVRTISEHRQEFEKEKAELQTKLVEAESIRVQTMDALKAQKQGNSEQIRYYQDKLEKFTAERNKIAQEYALFTNEYYRQEQKMKEERDRFLAVQAKLQLTLDEAKRKHAETLEALTEAPTESYKPISFPEQGEIDSLRGAITHFNSMKNRKELKEGLETTKIQLQELLNKLYKIGGFSDSTSRGDLESALNEMKTNTIEQREQQEKARKELIEKIKQKDLTNYNEEEVASLKKTNEYVATLDTFQKEIARKSRCLEGILEVSDLLEECSEAIRDAYDRNIANMWADAIQGAKDSPLAKIWADAMTDAKDSDYVRAWGAAIEDVNRNLAKAWTDTFQGIKDSPLPKIWGDAVKNANLLGKQFSNAYQDAKNTISNINIVK